MFKICSTEFYIRVLKFCRLEMAEDKLLRLPRICPQKGGKGCDIPHGYRICECVFPHAVGVLGFPSLHCKGNFSSLAY
jgi:hypothetical protein